MGENDGEIDSRLTIISGSPSGRTLRRCHKRSRTPNAKPPLGRYWFRVTGHGLFAHKHTLRVAVLEVVPPATGGAVWTLRGVVIDVNGIDPFLTSLTLANAVEVTYDTAERVGGIDDWESKQFEGWTIGQAASFAYNLR